MKTALHKRKRYTQLYQITSIFLLLLFASFTGYSNGETDGGVIGGGPFVFESVGDGIPDMIAEGSITLSDNVGENSQWIVTDDNGVILGLPPMPSAVNFDGAGPGTCLIWHLSYNGVIEGLEVGMHAENLSAECLDLSNSLEVIRSVEGDCQVNAGALFGGPFEFDMIGDGEPDMIAPGSITLANSQGENSQWIVTDDAGNILGLPPMPGVVNFDGAGPGLCRIWHLSYDGEIEGLAVGQNANDLAGDCFGLSNSIEVIRTVAGDCQANGGVLFGGPFEFCVDGIADNVSDITLANNSGANSQWIVTDLAGTILGLPPMPGVVDFDGAGTGVCLIWNISYDDGLEGLAMNENVSDLEGCYDISNAVYVYRSTSGAGCDPDCEAVGGTIEGGPFAFCVDGEADNVSGITLSGNEGTKNQWVVTDQAGTILGLPPMPGAVDFDGAGPGVCLIWNIAYEDGLTGLEMGNNISSGLEGCYSFSNQITVYRFETNGGVLEGGPFEFDMVGDGVPDMLAPGSITLSDNSGGNSQWIVTDDEGYILGLPPMPGAVDFDGAGPGTCLVWHLSYDGEINGLEMGANANDLTGDCFSLSNSVEVIRTVAGDCQANGGLLLGGPYAFDMVGDGVPDMLPEGTITLANSQGENSQWIVTDDEGYILGLPPMPGAVDFDGAGPGTCLVWHLSYDGEIDGLEMGANANDLSGDCFALSNSFEVIRMVAGDCQANGGLLIGGSYSFDMVGDGVPDMLPEGTITLANSQGENSQWIVTDDEGYILGLPPMPGAVDFDGAGPGTCLVWHLSYDGEIDGLEMGANANDLSGDCFALSNSFEVIRMVAGDCQANGGLLIGGSYSFDMVGDGVPDMLPEGTITLANSQGENSQWIVTDDEGYILGLPPMPGAVDFDGAGPGTCLVWHLSYDGEISGLNMGANANDLSGDCFALSNSFEVIRTVAGDCQANGGLLIGGSYAFDMVGDGVPDMLPEGTITLANSQGENSQWIVTDDEGYILGLPPMPGAVDFDGAGPGTCLVWHLSYDGEISGLEMGANANDLSGDCFSLSNSFEVIRTVAGDCQANGGLLIGGSYAFDMVGDGVPDMLPEGTITLANSQGENSQWIVTDDEGYILGLPPMPGAVDFDGAGPGTCLVWHLSYDGEISGLEMGLNANDLSGDCFALSNNFEVIRTVAGDCQANGGALFGGPFEFCVGDGVSDMIEEGLITLANSQGINSQWIVTDENGIILGLPPTPEAVDFEQAGVGVCLIWHLSYEDGLEGLEVEANAADLVGCFSLSNPIQVTRMDTGPDCIVATDEELLSSINIYPNPASDYITIDFGSEELERGSIEISDYQGRLLITRSFDENASAITLPTDGLNNGLYLLSIRTSENYISKKVIVNR